MSSKNGEAGMSAKKRRRRTIDTRKWRANITDRDGFLIPRSIQQTAAAGTSPQFPSGVHRYDDDTRAKELEERVRKRAEARMKREKEQLQQMNGYKKEKELKTLMQLIEGDENSAAAKDEVCDQVFYWARVYDVFALYCHSEHGFQAPMEYDEEKRQLMEKASKFSVRLKIEGDN